VLAAHFRALSSSLKDVDDRDEAEDDDIIMEEEEGLQHAQQVRRPVGVARALAAHRLISTCAGGPLEAQASDGVGGGGARRLGPSGGAQGQGADGFH